MHTVWQRPFERLGSLIELHSGKNADAPSLRAAVDRRQLELQHVGMEPGDLALLVHGNSIAFFIDLLAIWALGGCAVPLDPKSMPREVENILRHTRARALFLARPNPWLLRAKVWC